jgi:hypothetical protein
MPERGPRPAPRRDDDDPESKLPFAERWVAPFVREPLLWPVGLVLVVHAVAFLAPVLLLGLRDRRFGALGALALILVMSGDAARRELARRGRPGVVCGLLATIWGLAVLTAIAAHRTGIF